MATKILIFIPWSQSHSAESRTVWVKENHEDSKLHTDTNVSSFNLKEVFKEIMRPGMKKHLHEISVSLQY